MRSPGLFRRMNCLLETLVPTRQSSITSLVIILKASEEGPNKTQNQVNLLASNRGRLDSEIGQIPSELN